MSSAIVPARLLKGMGARARRSLGQHFLRAPWVLDHIMDAAALAPGEVVLEIGPGLGVLTERLAASGATLIALEKDARMVAHLREFTQRWPEVSVLDGDALDYDLSALPEAPVRKVVANLPYNVATPILFRLAEVRPPFADIVVMVQKEVADRILAEPGTRSYGALTVNLRMLVEARRVIDVPPSAFHPPPKVDSTVVQLVPWERPPGDPGSPRIFRRVIGAAFGSRRKTLRNALAIAGFSKEVADAALGEVGIDGGIRGERLDLDAFCALSRALSAQGGPAIPEDEGAPGGGDV